MKHRLENLRAALPRLLTLDRTVDDIKINQGRILSELNRNKTSTTLSDYEFKIFSQWGEDGILQHLTAALDIANRTFIEFGVEDFSESNCRYLMMKDAWQGFVIDGSPQHIARLKASPIYWQYQLAGREAFITRDNISALLDESGFAREVGILSVDIDGNDWFVLEALSAWRAEIIVVEYNAVFGHHHAVSVPYDPEFVRSRKHFSNLYWGASLPAFDHLLRPRGYEFVGANSTGSNAFFVRSDLINARVPAVSLAEGFRDVVFRDSRDERGNLTFLADQPRLDQIAALALVDVATGAMLKVGDLQEARDAG